MTDVICKTCVQTFRSDETHNCPGLAMTTPSDNLLERVAEAICDSMHKSEPRWPTLSDEVREHWRVYARAAIEASEMEKALEPFAAEAENYDFGDGSGPDLYGSPDASSLNEINDLTVGSLRKARATLSRMRDARGGGDAPAD